jgi:hypothetical protein
MDGLDEGQEERDHQHRSRSAFTDLHRDASLVWEFKKYLDGLAIDTVWHRGRCLAYGEGVTFWALAEMVRTNAGILEGRKAR